LNHKISYIINVRLRNIVFGKSFDIKKIEKEEALPRKNKSIKYRRFWEKSTTTSRFYTKPYSPWEGIY